MENTETTIFVMWDLHHIFFALHVVGFSDYGTDKYVGKSVLVYSLSLYLNPCRQHGTADLIIFLKICCKILPTVFTFLRR